LLAACSTTRELPQGKPHFKIGAPYEVGGRWYYPKEEPAYEATGVASWYGRDFDGKRTANGEIFDQNRLSAAHPTLPLPSLVEVQNLDNGRSIVVRVNDRGPFVSDRIIDLSRAAARALDFERQGLARVRLRYAGRADLFTLAEKGPGKVRVAAAEAARSAVQASAPRTPPPGLGAPAPIVPPAASNDAMETLITGALATPSPPEIWIAVAEYADLNALETARMALSGGDDWRVVSPPGAMGRYQLQVGPHADAFAAEARLAALREAGYSDARLVAEAY
jgi:rare lipoprotein A